jgi:hypothetical protein
LLCEIEDKKRARREEAIRLREEAKARRQVRPAQENCDGDTMEESKAEEGDDLVDDEMDEGYIDEVGSTQHFQLPFNQFELTDLAESIRAIPWLPY